MVKRIDVGINKWTRRYSFRVKSRRSNRKMLDTLFFPDMSNANVCILLMKPFRVYVHA